MKIKCIVGAVPLLRCIDCIHCGIIEHKRICHILFDKYFHDIDKYVYSEIHNEQLIKYNCPYYDIKEINIENCCFCSFKPRLDDYCELAKSCNKWVKCSHKEVPYNCPLKEKEKEII